MSISANAVLDALFLLAPQFYTTDQEQLTRIYQIIALVKCQVNPVVLSCCGATAYAFLVAHYLTLAANANLGMASNMAEGQLSIGFNVSPDMNALDMTPYGRSYRDLIRRTVVGSTVTNLPVSLGGVIQNAPVGCGCYGNAYGPWPYPS